MTFGLASAIGMISVKSTVVLPGLVGWLSDPKIVLIVAAWIVLAVLLILRRVITISDKNLAYITMITFFLTIFAFAGVTFFCGTRHDFTGSNTTVIQNSEQVQK